jgi:5,6,7,8-tetrahydromethanopterin hydro-lyase
LEPVRHHPLQTAAGTLEPRHEPRYGEGAPSITASHEEQITMDIWFRAGEATVLAKEGQVTDAMPEVVIGSVKGPVGTAFASMMGQAVGHTRFFVIRDLNQMVRPATMMTSKVTISSAAYVDLFGGVVQAALGDAIVDCLKEGILPEESGDELCMIITVWLDPRCPDDPNLDKKDLYRTNYEATKLAIARAMKGEPTVKELIANRDKIRHYALDGVLE